MHDNKRRQFDAEEAIDSALKQYAEVEPGLGFETRVAARVRERLAERRPVWGLVLARPVMWTAAVALLVIIGIAVFLSRPAKEIARKPGPAVQPPQVTEAPAQAKQERKATLPPKPRRAASPTGPTTAQVEHPQPPVRRVEPERGSFFSQPASRAERQLILLADASVVTPAPPRRQEPTPGEALRPEVEVAPLAVEPLAKPLPVSPTPIQEEEGSAR